MNSYKSLENSKIGIIGNGYMGKNIINYINEIKKQFFLNIDVVLITKNNIEYLLNDDFDYVINCAGNSGDFRDEILETVESNVCFLIHLLKKMKVKKSLLLLSSTRLYGFSSEKGKVFKEEDNSIDNHVELDFIYNGSKKLMESIAVNYSKNLFLNYKIKIGRLSNVYGKFNKLDDSTLIKKLIRLQQQKKEFVLNQNPESSKDYIYIDDAIDGLIKVLLDDSNEIIYNIGYGESTSLSEIIEILNLKCISDSIQKQIPMYSNISINKAKNILNFHPKINIVQGLKIL